MVWRIHGKQYDLTPYLDRHPGGKDILLKCDGERDLTALFETYHAFSNKEKIQAMLQTFEVKQEQIQKVQEQTNFDFTHYNALLHQIKVHFPNRLSTKATLSWTLQNILMLLIYGYSFYHAMFSSYYSLLLKCLFAMIAGFSYISLGFNVMHDASHYAISMNSRVNNLLNTAWNGWALWNANIWFYHHVLNHHSYTGKIQHDPDLYHLQPFLNKETTSSFSNKPLLLHNRSAYITYILTLFPGQFVGQAISYLKSIGPSQIFRIKIPKKQMYGLIDICLMAGNLFCLYNGGFLTTAAYFISLNFWYHINIIFDHDTYETVVENNYDGTDWLKLQVSNSGNCLNGNIIWTRLFGGINYQIEHHLFPNMSHIHYPIIAPIVKQYCHDNNIPYVNHPTLVGAYQSYLKMLQVRNSSVRLR